MTLERHRSKLIPDVDFSPEGGIFVTDMEGTFPLSAGRAKERKPLPKDHHMHRPPDDLQSYRSYDPRRDRDKRDSKRKFKGREPSNKFGQEVREITGTWNSKGTGSASLQRKLRRLKGGGKDPHLDPPGWEYDLEQPARAFGNPGTWSSAGGRRRRKMLEEQRRRSGGGGGHRGHGYPGSIGRNARSVRSLDLKAIKEYKANMKDARKRNSKMDSIYSNGVNLNGSAGKMPLISMVDLGAKNRRLVEEKLPGYIYIVGAILLLAIGTAKTLICWWHGYFCLLWTGLFVLIMGIIGATHKADYLTKWRNASYIFFGLLSAVCVLVSCALLLEVIVPVVTELAKDSTTDQIANVLVNFTNMHESLAIEIELKSMVYLNLGLDIAGLLVLLVNLFTLTGAMVAIGNHWEAVYLTTGECDHRGHPRFFNPFEQISIGQATMVMGIFVTALWVSTEYDHYYSPIWTGFFILLAGMFSLFHGKRVDSSTLGCLAIFLQVFSVLALTVASVFVLLGLVDDIETLENQGGILSSAEKGVRYASCSSEALYIFFVFINVIFVIGVLFRQCRAVCCGSCVEPNVSMT